MINANTDKIRPIVMIAPTIVRNCEIPGNPLSFGLMLISSGSSPGTVMAVVVMRSSMIAVS